MKITRRNFLKYCLGGAVLSITYPTFIERYIVETNRYQITVPRLPPAFEGLTIVHLTDIHYGPLVPMIEIRNIIQKANSIPRDLTVCTGDYIHAHEWEIDKIWPELMKLNAPMGVLSVLGNHDHWGGCAKRSIFWLENSGQNLRHKIRRFERNGQALWFVGAGDIWEDNVNLDDLMKPIPENDCRIVLAHNPDSADTIVKSNPDLMICGHTHGGQINVPFYGPPVLPVNNKNYSSGLKKSKRGFPVFISRGIGWAVYPVRFNCLPEIAVLRLNSR